jgi:NitT/TauT family transport system substrate-binding protein
VRCRRHGAVLHAAAAWIGLDQVETEDDHPKKTDWRFFNELKRELKARTKKGRLPMPMMQTRRRFLTALSAAGTAAVLPARPSLAAEGALETTTVRIARPPAEPSDGAGIGAAVYGGSDCWAPEYLANELLYAEGFTDVRSVETPPPSPVSIARGEVDFAMAYGSVLISAIDAGGCIEVFANEGIHTIADLKGKRVGIGNFGSSTHVLLAIMAAQIGLDPAKDIYWISGPSISPLLLVDGKIDALLSSPPASLDMRARHIGHVILNTTVDRPWSQYFCCMLGGNREYVRKYPVATKRVLRAILKAADFCAAEPARAARGMVDAGVAPRYDYALQMLTEDPFYKWREYDAEDTMRFYALRMRDAGFIKSSPQKIIADGTDWRFLNQLKRELKA